MSAVIIRPATLQDAKPLAHLAERTFRETFAAANDPTDMDLHCARNFGVDIQTQELSDPNYVTLLAEMAEQPVAFAQIRLCSPQVGIAADQPPSELYRLYVVEEWQGRGLAHDLMQRILSTAAQAGADCIWLGVWEHNPRAISFYRKYGFRVVGEHVFAVGNDQQRDLIMATAVNDSMR